MRVEGKIEGNIEIAGNKVKYHVASGGDSYQVCSQNKQAVKDAIFLRKGQRVIIRGAPEGDQINVKESWIDITCKG
jgi:hypothetical protein